MPTLYQSDLGKKILPPVIEDDSGLVSVRAIIIPTAALAANDVMEGPILPADHVPVDVIVDSDDLDTNGAPTITLDCGMMSGTPGNNDSSRTVGNEFFAASAIAQTGFTAGIARATKTAGMRIPPVGFDRSVGLKAAAGAATGVAPLTGLLVNRGQWQASTAYIAGDYVNLPTGVRMKCTTGGTSGATSPFLSTIAAYNTTTNDGTAVWTTVDPVIGLTLVYRPAYRGA